MKNHVLYYPNKESNEPNINELKSKLLNQNGSTKKILEALSIENAIKQSELIKMTGLHRNTVYKHLKRLKDINYIEKIRERDGSIIYNANKESTLDSNILYNVDMKSKRIENRKI
ncbi:winged helix-turn-helix transcriptional regulator [Candidatus Bathyarchaeota archaeon]|nr:winged helix-turn-helix transcriptional regulator [Candidatus Bathyarchaeota archaeon]